MARFQINYEIPDSTEETTVPYKEFIEWIETIVFSFFTVILIFTFLLRQVNVDGESMIPTLQDGEKLIVHHIMYTPERGDIIIVDSLGVGKPIVKRVIAVGGDTIDINFESGEVKVNGAVLDEPYIKDLTKLDEGGQSYPLTVPSGYYFVMGDNRMNSLDSRSERVGLVPEDEIAGKVIFRIWPADRLGKIGE